MGPCKLTGGAYHSEVTRTACVDYGECPVCVAKERDALKAKLADSEAACAALTNGIEEAWETRPIAADSIPLGSFIDKCVTVARGDAGRGWHSPQEWEAVQAKMAEKHHALQWLWSAILTPDYDYDEAAKIVEPALSTDAGQPILDFIAAARRLRIIIDLRLSFNQQNLLGSYLADVDAAEAKLGGKQ